MSSFKNKLDAVSSFSMNEYEYLIEKLNIGLIESPSLIADLQSHGYALLNMLFRNNKITFTEKINVINLLKDNGYQLNEYNPSIHAKNFVMEYIESSKRKPKLNKLKTLVDLGINVNHNSGYLLAALENAPYLLEGLIDMGADINKRYAYKYTSITPIEYAILEGRVDFFDKLVSLGADVKYLDDRHSETLIHFLSLRVSNSSAKELLVDGEYTDLHVGFLKSLVKLGVDINAVNQEGNTALMAVYSDFMEMKKAPTILTEMIKKIYGISKIDKMLTDMMSNYIECGAKIDIPNNKGLILLDICPKAMPMLYSCIEKEMINSSTVLSDKKETKMKV